jgi:hypothetical protein
MPWSGNVVIITSLIRNLCVSIVHASSVCRPPVPFCQVTAIPEGPHTDLRPASPLVTPPAGE